MTVACISPHSPRQWLYIPVIRKSLPSYLYLLDPEHAADNLIVVLLLITLFFHIELLSPISYLLQCLVLRVYGSPAGNIREGLHHWKNNSGYRFSKDWFVL
jgi:hypothetical protein